jgi:TolB-like protein/Tfp pilus assembly protein PilF
MSVAQNQAVFLSYASQDAEAARKICDALRSGGVEVWFDADGGLEHGDEWDAKIRQQIKACVLFIPIISANTQARHEGYFRIEWDLAAERARGIASGVPFILPVVIDDTREPEALVPDRFRMVHWTKLPGGVVTPEVKARYLKLWSHRTGVLRHAAETATESPSAIVGAGNGNGPQKWRAGVLAAICFAVVVTLGGLAIWRPWKGSTTVGVAASSPEVADLIRRAWKLVDNPGRGRAELETADDLCKRAAALEPTNASVLAVWSQVDSWMILVKVDDSATRREAGRIKARRAVQLAPDAFESRLALACFQVRDVGYAAPENAAEIEATLRGLLRERPGQPHALTALGMLQRFTGKFAESRQTFEELARNPEFAAAAWCEMAYMHYEARNFSAAEEAVDASIAIQPFFWNLRMKMELLLYWRGDLDQALATVQRVSSEVLREDHGFEAAFAVHTQRRDGQAMLRLMEITPREWIGGPSPGPKAGYMAVAYKFLGRDQAAAIERTTALRVIERRLNETPNVVELLSWKCWLLAEHGDEAEARRVSQLLHQIRTPGERSGELVDRALLKDLDTAIDILEGLEKEPPNPFFTAAFVRHTWWLDSLRAHPRFQALQARMDADPRFSPAAKVSAAPATLKPDAKSLVVLPFDNLSDDKANDIFSDGVSEELINALGRVPGLTVKGRTSAFFFKGKNATTQEIQEKLGVAFFVRGTVRKAGNKVRVTAQLCRSATDEIVWSLPPLERELKDIFAVQDEIAGLIAKNLSLVLGTGSAASTAPVNPEAFELYVQARQAWNLRTLAGFARADALLQAALEREPNFSRAHAALADVWSTRRQEDPDGSSFQTRNSAQVARAISQARKAIDLDPSLAEAHAALGGILWTDAWKTDEAEVALRRAVELNSNYAPARQWLGRVLFRRGRVDEGLAELKIAAELEPLSHRIQDNYGSALMYAGRWVEAAAMYERALALQPESEAALLGKAQLLMLRAQKAQAVALVAKPPTAFNAATYRLVVLAQGGKAAEAEKQLRAGTTPVFEPWRVLLALGHREEALATLNANQTVAYMVESWFYLPLFDPIRQEPRFRQYVAALNLTEDHARAQAWRAAHPPKEMAAQR